MRRHGQSSFEKKIQKKFKGNLSNSKLKTFQGSPSSGFLQGTLKGDLEEVSLKSVNVWHRRWRLWKKIPKKFKGSLSNSKLKTFQGSPSSRFLQGTLEGNLEEFCYTYQLLTCTMEAEKWYPEKIQRNGSNLILNESIVGQLLSLAKRPWNMI